MNRLTVFVKFLQENARERLRMIQKILPPPSLGEGPLRELFKEQEQERYELRMKHVVEKEKLVLAVEQVNPYDGLNQHCIMFVLNKVNM